MLVVMFTTVGQKSRATNESWRLARATHSRFLPYIIYKGVSGRANNDNFIFTLTHTHRQMSSLRFLEKLKEEKMCTIKDNF
jgi:hypothetical protein